MLKLSANLGFLWQQYDLLDGIRAAAKAGFVAVECHWPFDYSAQDVSQVLRETGLPMLVLNTYPGDRKQGEFGYCALPNKIHQARITIDQALNYAAKINTPQVHIMSGKVDASIDAERALQTFLDNLNYAANIAEEAGIGLLIEPINNIDVPDYFVCDIPKAVEIIKKANLPNLKIMLDCFHIQKIHGEIKRYIEQNLGLIGHIQIASYPDRHEPDEGKINYTDLFKFLEKLDYSGAVGAEYKPRTTTDEGLAWIANYCKNSIYPQKK